MTVPGKGGRPRKWRSDADRVRAHRARQRGEDEPPTVERALVAGDEAAVAWERVRELGVTIEDQRSELKSLAARSVAARNRSIRNGLDSLGSRLTTIGCATSWPRRSASAIYFGIDSMSRRAQCRRGLNGLHNDLTTFDRIEHNVALRTVSDAARTEAKVVSPRQRSRS